MLTTGQSCACKALCKHPMCVPHESMNVQGPLPKSNVAHADFCSLTVRVGGKRPRQKVGGWDDHTLWVMRMMSVLLRSSCHLNALLTSHYCQDWRWLLRDPVTASGTTRRGEWFGSQSRDNQHHATKVHRGASIGPWLSWTLNSMRQNMTRSSTSLVGFQFNTWNTMQPICCSARIRSLGRGPCRHRPFENEDLLGSNRCWSWCAGSAHPSSLWLWLSWKVFWTRWWMRPGRRLCPFGPMNGGGSLCTEACQQQWTWHDSKERV